MATRWDDDIERSRLAGTRELTGTLIAERAIVRKYVKEIVRRGYAVRVWDGEAYVRFERPCPGMLGLAHTFSRSAKAIVAAMGSTDSDVLHMYDAGKRVGWISFVYGKRIGWMLFVYSNAPGEVLNDYSDNAETRAIVRAVTGEE